MTLTAAICGPSRSRASKPTRLTGGDGIEWSPVMMHDGATIALLHSDAQRPARPAVLASGGEIRDLAPESLPADFPSAELVTPQQVILTASDGLRVHAQLFLPKDGAAGERHPAVIFMHGGSRREMLLGWHYMGYYHNAYALNQYLASRGYVVLSLNYRSGIGYGLDFREALNYGPSGASEFNDVEGAGLYLRQRADVDPARIGLWGGSYGGYLDGAGSGSSLRSFRLRRRPARRARLEPRNRELAAFARARGSFEAGVGVVAAGVGGHVALARVAGAGGRRPQRALLGNGPPGRGAAETEGGIPAACFPQRDSRFPAA